MTKVQRLIQITKLLAEKGYGPKFLFEVKDSFLDKNVHLEELKMPNVEIINEMYVGGY